MMADPIRFAELAVTYFNDAGVRMSPNSRGLEFLASAMPMATGSVDRLDQVPARLAFLFDYDAEAALRDERVGGEMRDAGAQAVVRALAGELATAPRLDRERFRSVANAVKARTGQTGKALFHPIRVALTGRADGPELDLAIQAIDGGAGLTTVSWFPKNVGCSTSEAAFVYALHPETR